MMRFTLAIVFGLFVSVGALAQETGQQIFEAACIGCHGPGGKGQPETTLGFEPPSTFPDFTDCNGSTREKTFDWRATIHEGGKGRGFSEIMPSFAEALTMEQIDKIIAYLRERCVEKGWPLGELNLPRGLAVEKAFPEDEWLLQTDIDTNGNALSLQLLYEKRFGARNQIEIGVPFNFLKRTNASWVGGVGDIVLGYKYVIAHSGKKGSILSWQGEIIAPAGNRLRDLGSGVTTLETFASFGQILPRMSFIQMQAGGEFPTNAQRGNKAAYWRLNAGKSLAQNKGFGRLWTPMLELLADREIVSGAHVNWDAIPQMQVTLNRRQHVRMNVGLRMPVNNVRGRSKQLIFYFLWDFFDGGLREGW
jgi:hypothetical protein